MVSHRRPRVVVTIVISLVFPVLAPLVLSGCGGGSDRDPDRDRSPGPAATAEAGTTSPPPVFDFDHVKGALLAPKDVAADVRPQAPTFPGLTEAAVPGCSASTIGLPGRPKTIGRQLETSKRGFTGTHYIQLVAVYPNVAAATGALARVRDKATACPAKRHFPGKRLGGRRFTIEHTDTWKLSEDAVAGWTHVRGFEKHVEPPSTSRYNVFYDIYDYAARGNVLIASLYWERVKPAVDGQRIAAKASAVLSKQLQKIG